MFSQLGGFVSFFSHFLFCGAFLDSEVHQHFSYFIKAFRMHAGIFQYTSACVNMVYISVYLHFMGNFLRLLLNRFTFSQTTFKTPGYTSELKGGRFRYVFCKSVQREQGECIHASCMLCNAQYEEIGKNWMKIVSFSMKNKS